jgi:hypothetical protein
MSAEAVALASLADASGWRDRQQGLLAFHERRVALADQLADFFEPDRAFEV